MRKIFYSIILVLFLNSVFSQNTSFDQFSSPTIRTKYVNTEFSLSPYTYEDSNKIKYDLFFWAPGIGLNMNYLIGRYTSFSFGLSFKTSFIHANHCGLGINQDDIIKNKIPPPDLSNYQSGSYLKGIRIGKPDIVAFMNYGFYLPITFEFYFQEYDEHYLNFYLGGGLDLIYRHYNYSLQVDSYTIIGPYNQEEYFRVYFRDHVSTIQAIALIKGGLIFPISRNTLFDVGIEGGYGTGNTLHTSVVGRFKFRI